MNSVFASTVLGKKEVEVPWRIIYCGPRDVNSVDSAVSTLRLLVRKQCYLFNASSVAVVNFIWFNILLAMLLCDHMSVVGDCAAAKNSCKDDIGTIGGKPEKQEPSAFGTTFT